MSLYPWFTELSVKFDEKIFLDTFYFKLFLKLIFNFNFCTFKIPILG